MKIINFTTEQIEEARKDPRVKYIDQYSIRFKLEFRQQLYDYCYPEFNISTIRSALKFYNFNIETCSIILISLYRNFKKRRPCGAKNNDIYALELYCNPDKNYDKVLVDSGMFITSRNGIAPSQKLLEDIYSVYPAISVENFLASLGLDINRIGYQRIHNILKELENPTPKSVIFTNEQIEILKTNPYIKRVNKNQLSFNDNFYFEARYYKELHINEILKIFEIDPTWINYSRKNNIYNSIRNKKISTILPLKKNISLLIRVEKRKNELLNNMVNVNSRIIIPKIKTTSCSSKKTICNLIKNIDCTNLYSISIIKLLSIFGISKSSYYSILKNDEYGTFEAKKDKLDKEEIGIIKEIIDYKGYPKGNRLIFMLLNRKGYHMSRNKIYRLCKKGNLICNIRKHNKSRQAAKKMLDENCKPNQLKRRFRLFKPGEVILTDVSYLKCEKETYYLSALKDACSGKVKLLVSSNNDLKLGMNTLDLLTPKNGNSILHSDQGVIYLNSFFQTRVKELGYNQSMSKRGNCWDNAPQESFFGHMKDECDIWSCLSLEEITSMISKYELYYNYERPQWNRNQMTPIDFEKYINNMNSIEYEGYLAIEEAKYKKMMENARIKAIKRVKDISIEAI